MVHSCAGGPPSSDRGRPLCYSRLVHANSVGKDATVSRAWISDIKSASSRSIRVPRSGGHIWRPTGLMICDVTSCLPALGMAFHCSALMRPVVNARWSGTWDAWPLGSRQPHADERRAGQHLALLERNGRVAPLSGPCGRDRSGARGRRCRRQSGGWSGSCEPPSSGTHLTAFARVGRARAGNSALCRYAHARDRPRARAMAFHGARAALP